ncbi:hypothetical protein FKM82_011752 [Ascaphus truei]
MSFLQLVLCAALLSWATTGLRSDEQRRAQRRFSTELKCGARPAMSKSEHLSEFTSRIVGGRKSVPGGQPWAVSLQLHKGHFCGGSIMRRSVVVTAAHCVHPVDKIEMSHMTVVAGEYDQDGTDPQAQSIPVSRIVTHPLYSRDGNMSYDIALVYLARKITLGSRVQPICLPQVDEQIEAGTLCVSCGWGRMTENGELSAVLQEVKLPIIDHDTCSSVLDSMGLPSLHETMLCAGFPDGGKDACQGDSGGPLACRRRSGTWYLAGCASWGLGCGRTWGAPQVGHESDERGSPAIFSKVSALLDFLTTGTHDGGSNPKMQKITGENGMIKYPLSMNSRYSNKSLFIWTITVQEDKMIQIRMIQLDIEFHVTCDHDYLSFTVKEKLISKMCGSVTPSPLLIPSNHVTVTFSSDGSITGYGFELHFSASPAISGAGSGCGSVAVLKEEGKIDTVNYPGSYESLTSCHWIIEAPKDHIIKLIFEDFAVEFEKDCEYDHVSVYDDIEETWLIARLCGFSLPAPVFSPRNTMLIRFNSDQENNYPGFKARFVFLHSKYAVSNLTTDHTPVTVKISKPKSVPLGVCGKAPLTSWWTLSRVVGGEEACPNCWPWQVGLLFLRGFQCGGVILSSQWVLTAAHCMQSSDPSHWVVVAGDHDRMLNESTEQIRTVRTIVVHEKFDPVSYDYDIALIWLEEPLEFSDFVRPVCLPSSNESLAPSSVCVVTGWGNTQEVGELAIRLQQLMVPILDGKVCDSFYYSTHPKGITDHMLCAGFPSTHGKDSCQGDSGGPLVCPNEKKHFILHGIVSWGVGCARAKKPGVYTRVQVFLSWIKSTQAVVESTRDIEHSSVTVKQPVLGDEITAVHGCLSEVQLNGSVGSFASPGYPSGYPGGLNCSWVIHVSTSSMIKITIEQLSIEESEDCANESLSVYQEDTKGRLLLGRRCGFLSSPVIYTSGGPVIKVLFHSSGPGSYGKRGFVLLYRIYGGQVPIFRSLTGDSSRTKSGPLERCNDVILTREGIITSPGYPEDYPDNLSCQWRIIAPLRSIVHLDLQDFKTEGNTSGCQDKLLVYDGVGESKTLLGTFCGEMHSYSMKSDGPEMTLVFITNSNVTMRGFTLRYSFREIQPNTSCPILDLLAAGSAEIKSPRYPRTYPNRQDCQWIIYSTAGKRLQLLVRDLSIEDSANCTWDSLNVHDGSNNGSHLLASLCGQKTGLVLQSSGSFLTLHFHTDKSVGDRGFRIQYGDLAELSVKARRMWGSPRNEQCGNMAVDPIVMGKSHIDAKVITDQEGNPRVVGGYPAPLKSWPWIVSLQTKKKKHFCGGTIIHRKWILSAAHCDFRLGSDRVFVGQTDFSRRESVEAFVKKSYVHKRYHPEHIPPTNDLVLLELKTPLTLGVSVAVICLPKKDEYFRNSSCIVAGWGFTNPHIPQYTLFLQQAKVPLLSKRFCKSYWGTDITDHNVCAGSAGATSCMGDSGGPLICKVHDQYKLIGVVSWGSDKCDTKAPAVYTSVSAYMDWISYYIGYQ